MSVTSSSVLSTAHLLKLSTNALFQPNLVSNIFAPNETLGNFLIKNKIEADYSDVVAPEQNEKAQQTSTSIVLASSTTSSQSAADHSHHFDSKTAIAIRAATKSLSSSKVDPPVFHPHWKLIRVLSGHDGWVRTVAVEPNNEWFATGSNDRAIKIWSMTTGVLKLTLANHISAVTGLEVSSRHPYLFSCGEDKKVLCWDLEQNKVVRHYHGHHSGVFCLSVHPSLDLLVTGGRDSAARVWDIRTKMEVLQLSGHSNTVMSLITQNASPHVITGGADSTIRLWDLRKAERPLDQLTYHKKSVRALCRHPYQFTFVSGGQDNVKKYSFEGPTFLGNLDNAGTRINSLSINPELESITSASPSSDSLSSDSSSSSSSSLELSLKSSSASTVVSGGVLAGGCSDGSVAFWDWRTGYLFQKIRPPVQVGSLESEYGVECVTFDKSGTRLITTNDDKTIKIFGEDPDSSPATDPITWTPSKPK
ncbi:pre-mRNA-splicing factor prp46 [Monocercomonoides exilis]|uniref:pre-mRNA-splicing factor prp46 n=1 Tax=Monocercomonoides exilis TaxID=2049356 RepID=UPI00355A1D0D|nr:pre-mRNA-splicing factor prp46 [Monocercomonoides exilis]|eukprot:MONOS_3163.1-p1 / transcript=MONOS_3163.1 / gene=MONOS_3163 / organism=Monocercomonoides_exilis_PA203 / gene_product=pre-mRNA-splicing factor prp46 / transcript_product=pre-mRNA-splicing factor prp46 / location=Mono_scaffold00072:63201-65369(-) / protein_length=477 / sequence_SO=supercontig / SO=protein_coding / is_pseudo=false